MKKIAVLHLSLLFFFLALPVHLFAKEEADHIYFGVGATINQAQPGEYVVKTKGEKAEEGFVYTPKGKFTSTKIEYKVTLKGTGKHFLVIEETDARGNFINEKKWPIELTDNWKTFSVPYQLKDTTSQIDVFVRTSTQAKTQFSFKDLQVLNL